MKIEKVTRDGSPMPSHTMKSGASAIFGMSWNTATLAIIGIVVGEFHRWIHALDLRVGVVDGVTVAVPGRLDDVDEAYQPVDRFVQPAGTERGPVAALVHDVPPMLLARADEVIE